jgi:hypothetical protein
VADRLWARLHTALSLVAGVLAAGWFCGGTADGEDPVAGSDDTDDDGLHGIVLPTPYDLADATLVGTNARDTSEVLRSDVSRCDPDFEGLTAPTSAAKSASDLHRILTHGMPTSMPTATSGSAA